MCKVFRTKCRATVQDFLEKAPAWGVACSSFGPKKLNFLQLWQHRCRKGVSEQKVCRQLPWHLTHTCIGRRTEDLTYWQASQSWHPSTLSITSKDTDGLKAVAKGILGAKGEGGGVWEEGWGSERSALEAHCWTGLHCQPGTGHGTSNAVVHLDCICCLIRSMQSNFGHMRLRIESWGFLLISTYKG